MKEFLYPFWWLQIVTVQFWIALINYHFNADWKPFHAFCSAIDFKLKWGHFALLNICDFENLYKWFSNKIVFTLNSNVKKKHSFTYLFIYLHYKMMSVLGWPLRSVFQLFVLSAHISSRIECHTECCFQWIYTTNSEMLEISVYLFGHHKRFSNCYSVYYCWH